jgi:hypothetical protein
MPFRTSPHRWKIITALASSLITRINNISLVGVSEPIAAQIVGNLSLEGTVRFEMTDGAIITLVRP